MEACILRFNRRRRSDLVFAHHRCGLLFLVDNEGCTTGLCVAAGATRVALLRVKNFVCFESWTAKDALNKVQLQLMLLAVTLVNSALTIYPIHVKYEEW